MCWTETQEQHFSYRFKGELKAHIHISLYESNKLQEYDAVIPFLSVIPWGENIAYCHQPAKPLAAPGSSHVLQLLSAVTQRVAAHFMSPSSEQCIIDCSALHTNSLRKLHKKTCMGIKQANGKIMSSNWLYKKTGWYNTGIIHDRAPDCHPLYDQSQLSIALIRKLRASLICVAQFLTS